jgi:hypothetical protein
VNAVVGHAIKVGGVQVGVTRPAHRLAAVLIAENPNHVGAIQRLFGIGLWLNVFHDVCPVVSLLAMSLNSFT